MELRILMIFYHSTFDYLNEEQLLCYDFINCYGQNYEVSDYNLHGNSEYKFGEIANRKSLIHEAVRQLVLKGLINPVPENGFKHEINDSGINYIESLNNDYCNRYLEIAKVSSEKFELTVEEAQKFIKNLILKGGKVNDKN